MELLETGDGADDPQVTEYNHNDGYSKEEVEGSTNDRRIDSFYT